MPGAPHIRAVRMCGSGIVPPAKADSGILRCSNSGLTPWANVVPPFGLSGGWPTQAGFVWVGISCTSKNRHPSQKKAGLGHPARRGHGLTQTRVGKECGRCARDGNLIRDADLGRGRCGWSSGQSALLFRLLGTAAVPQHGQS